MCCVPFNVAALEGTGAGVPVLLKGTGAGYLLTIALVSQREMMFALKRGRCTYFATKIAPIGRTNRYYVVELLRRRRTYYA